MKLDSVWTRYIKSSPLLLFGMLLDRMGWEALWVSGGLCLPALVALLSLKGCAAPLEELCGKLGDDGMR
jgi:hypothetical protein